MDVLVCVPHSLTRRLGAPKAYLELADALERQGARCTVVGRDTVAPRLAEQEGWIARKIHYTRRLRAYLAAHAGDYDVVEYEHDALPVPRSALPPEPLLVARTALLTHHRFDPYLTYAAEPQLAAAVATNAVRDGLASGELDLPLRTYARAAKKHLGTAARRLRQRTRRAAMLDRVHRTLRTADRVVVNNRHDRQRLAAAGLPPEKVTVLPLGLTAPRRRALAATPAPAPSAPPRVAMIGTFESRKGARDLPRILRRLAAHHPAVRLRLLGTKGLFETKHEVRAHFPPSLRHRVEVVPRFAPERLPDLLADTHVGMLPSYYEGFGYGVLELLAAGRPTVAYDVPGPPEMLPPEALAPRGDWRTLADRLTALLSAPDQRRERGRNARERTGTFGWDALAQRRLALYRKTDHVTVSTDDAP